MTNPLFVVTAITVTVAWLSMVIWTIFAAYLAYRQFKPSPQQPAPKAQPGVTILRPLRGVDNALADNLTSSFALLYDGPLEVLLSVADDEDAAIPVAKKVMLQNPQVDARLIVGERVVGVNPKVNNLVRSYQEAKYDYVWICDSNVYVEPDTLLTAMEAFGRDGKVGLVHHTPEGQHGDTLGATLEQHFLNTAHAKIYLVINWMAVDSCVMGKSTIFRKSDLDRVGGLESFGKYMAEDNMIGIAIMKQGYKHFMSRRTAQQSLSKLSVLDYIKRRSRWTRIRAYSMPFVTIAEPFTESLICGLTGATALWVLSGYFWSVFGLHMLTWMVADYFLTVNLIRRPVTDMPYFFATWFLRELSAVPIYLYALLGSNRVVWRERAYKLKLGGLCEPIQTMPMSPTQQQKPWSLTGSTSYMETCFLVDFVIYLLSKLTTRFTQKSE